MTGGGSIFTQDGTRVTHGFTLFRNIEKKANNIQVNWGKGNKFHLSGLEDISYISLNNGVIARGTGGGKLNGVEGATVKFAFADFGETGTEDLNEIIITDSNGIEVLRVINSLNKGNDQFHAK